MLLADPAVRQMVRSLVESALGTPGMGLDYLSYNPRKTIDYNIAAEQRTNAMLRYFSTGQTNAYREILDAATTNFMRLWGYNTRQEAGWLAKLAGSQLIAPQIKSAAWAIGGGFYGHLDQWSPDARYGVGGRAGVDAAAAVKYLNTANAVMQETLTTAAKRGFGGMAIEDVGALVGEYARLGGYSNLPQNDGERKARITEIQHEVQKYAESINMIRDVVDGPLEKILSSFEELTGSKLVSTATGRVSSIASAMRNVLADGRVTEQALRQLTGVQYGLIAPLGGSQMQAAAMAVANAAAMNSGVRIEGLSGIEFGNALAKDNAKMLINGNLRNVAAALVHMRGGREDTGELRDQLVRALAERGGGDIAAGAASYLRQNGVSAVFMGSSEVTRATADTNTITALRMNYVRQYNAVREGIIGRGTTEDKRAILTNVLGSSYDSAEIQRRLMASGKFNAEEAARIATEVGTSARLITGADSDASAMALIGSAVGAANTTERNLAGEAYRHIRGQVSPGGFPGILSALMDSKTDAMSVARLVQYWTGIRPNMGAGADRSVIIDNLSRSFGINRKELTTLFDTALKLGTTGEAILLARRGFKRNAKGEATEQLSAKDANEARKKLLDIASGKTSATYAKISEIAGGLEISDKDLNRIYLQGRLKGREITEKDLTDFGKYREEFINKGIKGDVDERAARKVRLRQAVDELRAINERRDKPLDRKQFIEQVMDRQLFKKYVADFGVADTKALAQELSKQDPLLTILGDILEAIKGLGGGRAGAKSQE